MRVNKLKLSKKKEAKKTRNDFLLSFFIDSEEDFKIVNGFFLKKIYSSQIEQYWVDVRRTLLDKMQ